MANKSVIMTTIRVMDIDGKAARRLIGGLIKSARKAKGLTQDECCYMLGVGRPQLCNIEIGNSGISTETLIRAVINLGISITPQTFGAP